MVRDVPFKIMIGLIDDVFIINKLYCGHLSKMRIHLNSAF